MSQEPDYLPAHIVAWAQERQQSLDLIVSTLLETGEWPTTKGLTRELARAGKPVPLASILQDIPRPLGFVENGPGRIVLLLPCLRLVPGAEALLDGFVTLVKLGLERYRGEDEPPEITRQDIADVIQGEIQQRALSEIFLREAPFYGSGTGGPDDEWTREVTDEIVRFWDVVTADDYLRIRTEQLSTSPQFGYLASGPEAKTVQRLAGEQRDVFISHASEDKEAIARPLTEALAARGYTVWFDEYEIVLGDSLRRKIERGLAQSRLGVVILSKSFFAKEWPKQELNALYSRLVGGEENVIVPIWHQMTREQVADHDVLLADLYAGNSDAGVDRLADEVGRTLELRRQAATPSPEIPTAPLPEPAAEAPVEAPREPAPVGRGTSVPAPPHAEQPPAGKPPSPFPSRAITAPQSGPESPASRLSGRRPPLGAVNFDMEPGVLNIAALELVRDGDTIALQHLFNDAIARGRQAVDISDLDALGELLDRLTCLAATFLTLDQDERVSDVIGVMARVYGMPLRPGDAQRFGYSTRINPEEMAPRLWFQTLERLYGLGALAVRYEKWNVLRTIGLQKPEGAAEYEKNWLRHALTMSARAGLLQQVEDDRTVEVSLLVLARDQVARLACLRPDGLASTDDRILTSLAQFDALWNLVAIDDSGDASGRDFYPHFARLYANRVTPVVEQLLSDHDMRHALFQRSDADLAIALQSVGALAQREGWRYDGFTDWGSRITEFVDANIPQEEPEESG